MNREQPMQTSTASGRRVISHLIRVKVPCPPLSPPHAVLRARRDAASRTNRSRTNCMMAQTWTPWLHTPRQRKICPVQVCRGIRDGSWPRVNRSLATPRSFRPRLFWVSPRRWLALPVHRRRFWVSRGSSSGSGWPPVGPEGRMCPRPSLPPRPRIPHLPKSLNLRRPRRLKSLNLRRPRRLKSRILRTLRHPKSPSRAQRSRV